LAQQLAGAAGKVFHQRLAVLQQRQYVAAHHRLEQVFFVFEIKI
jgi:hypothetical protein